VPEPESVKGMVFGRGQVVEKARVEATRVRVRGRMIEAMIRLEKNSRCGASVSRGSRSW